MLQLKQVNRLHLKDWVSAAAQQVPDLDLCRAKQPSTKALKWDFWIYKTCPLVNKTIVDPSEGLFIQIMSYELHMHLSKFRKWHNIKLDKS